MGATVANTEHPGGIAAGLGIGIRWLRQGDFVVGADVDADETFGRLTATMFNTALLFGHHGPRWRFEAGPLLTLAWNDVYDRRLGYDASRNTWSTSSVGMRAQVLVKVGDRYSVGLSVDGGLAAMPHAEGAVRFGVRL